jgi:hypothetical protein
MVRVVAHEHVVQDAASKVTSRTLTNVMKLQVLAATAVR